MSPDDLATLHSQIIDTKLADLSELFKSVNVDMAAKVQALFNSLELDNNGKVANTRNNTELINLGIGLVRKTTRTTRPLVFNQYLEAADKINKLAETYALGLREKKNGKEKNG